MRRLLATACVAVALLGGPSSSLQAAPYAGAWVAFPPPRDVRDHIVYDPAGDRMLAIDQTTGMLFQLPLAGTPAWSVIPTSGTAPFNDNSIAFDTARNRILVFNSSGAGPKLWALPLASPTWTDITPPGAGPSVRDGSTLLYDPVRDQLLIYGGAKGCGSFCITGYAETWQVPFVGPPSWNLMSTAGTTPPGRFNAGAIYDPVRDRMVICAGGTGCCGAVAQTDPWALTLSGTPTWSHIIPSGPLPPGRHDPILAYDPGGDRMVMTCGYSSDSKVWALPLTGTPAWSEILPTTTLPESPEEGFYDPVRQRIVAHATKTWGFALTGPSAWSGLVANETVPAQLGAYESSYDSKRHLMILHGALSDPPNNTQTWSLTLGAAESWTLLNTTDGSTVPGSGQAQIYDPVRDRTLIFGGNSNKVWALYPSFTSNWVQLTPSGTPPTVRSGSLAIYDPTGDRMVVFGGYNSTYFYPYLDEVWELRLTGSQVSPVWNQLTPAGTPPPGRKDHVAVYDPIRQRMLIFGGSTNPSGGVLNDVWALNLASLTWEQLNPVGTPPPARADAAGAYIASQDALVISGHVAGNPWRLLLSGTSSWSQIAPTGTSPNNAGQQTAVYDYDHNRMVIYGTGTGASNTWAIDWTGVTTAVDPSSAPRSLSVAAVASIMDQGRDLVARIVLPSDAPATLRVYDVTGRVIDSRDLRALGPGPHDVTMSGLARHPAGVYLLRLAQDGRSARAKAVLLH